MAQALVPLAPVLAPLGVGAAAGALLQVLPPLPAVLVPSCQPGNAWHAPRVSARVCECVYGSLNCRLQACLDPKHRMCAEYVCWLHMLLSDDASTRLLVLQSGLGRVAGVAWHAQQTEQCSWVSIKCRCGLVALPDTTKGPAQLQALMADRW